MTLDDKVNLIRQRVASEIGVLNKGGGNPNHDPKSGRFSTGSGGTSPSGSTGGTSTTSGTTPPAATPRNEASIRADAERMVREMTPDDAYLGGKLAGISRDLGLQAKKGPIKKPNRMTEKAVEELGGDVFGMKDVVRGTIALQDYAQTQDVVNRIGQDFEIDRVKELKAGGYRDIKVNVKLPSSGYVGEIIVIAPEYLQAKMQPTLYKESGHDLYDVIRSPQTSKAEKNDAIAKSEKIYAQAEREYLDRTSKGEKLTLSDL